MSKVNDLIAAMREAGGRKERLTAGWLALSSDHKGLRSAIYAVFKTRPTTQKLGAWLSEHVNTRHGALELIGRHSTHDKAWRYTVRHDGDAVAAGAARAARMSNPFLRGDAPAPVSIVVTPPAPPPLPAHTPPQPKQPQQPQQPQHGDIVTDATGQRWLYQLRLVDGQPRMMRAPIPQKPKAEPPKEEAKPAEPERPKTRVEQMREDYLRRQQPDNQRVYRDGHGALAEGWSNPGGVVSYNIGREGGMDARTRKLRLLDF